VLKRLIIVIHVLWLVMLIHVLDVLLDGLWMLERARHAEKQYKDVPRVMWLMDRLTVWLVQLSLYYSMESVLHVIRLLITARVMVALQRIIFHGVMFAIKGMWEMEMETAWLIVILRIVRSVW